MTKRAWLTTDAPTELVCRRVLVPDSMTHILSGAIGMMGDSWNWEQFGDLTIEQSAALGFDVYASIEDCELDKRMIGSIQYYAGVIPDGVLVCDGSNYNEIDYPDLYVSLSGVGGDFDVPDLRDKFIVGAGLAYSVGQVGGAVDHTLDISEIPSHEHLSHSHDVNVDLEAVGAPDVSAGVGLPDPTGATGGGQAHNNLPPYYALVAGIVALPVIAGGGGGGGDVGVAIIVDEKSNGTHGGTFSANTWHTRILNTLRVSPSWIALSSNEFTLSEGTYLIMAACPAMDVDRHQTRIFKVGDSSYMMGQSSPDTGLSLAFGVVSVASSEDYRIEHRGRTTRTSLGFGRAASVGEDEVYTKVVVIKYE